METEMQANVAAFEQTLRSTIALAGTFAAGDWTRPTDCPGWSVQDVVSHMVGTELMLLGEDPAGGHVLAEEPAHVRNDLGRLIEPGVDARRGRSGPEVLAELREVLDRRLEALAATDPERPTTAPTGATVPYKEFMVFRAFDCYIHEQDIRRAVGRPGNLDAPAAACARRIMEPGLPVIVGRRSGAAPKQTVLFEVSGAVPFAARIQVGEDGRARPVEAGTPDVTLRMDWEAFMVLVAGRRTPADVAVDVTGDTALGGRVLANMTLTP
ncbi:maleylpyruvate isomerase family mycothiol-dependent enzyme [Spirillospora sp. NPDC029432]|uniref:maleylpyruvate isomerase family mycothiol-dependent enzyme n=1 Tax=Spirillospora sp. NPDC029432 TaxID=3154599 RepID=UPI0034535C78